MKICGIFRVSEESSIVRDVVFSPIAGKLALHARLF